VNKQSIAELFFLFNKLDKTYSWFLYAFFLILRYDVGFFNLFLQFNVDNRNYSASVFHLRVEFRGWFFDSLFRFYLFLLLFVFDLYKNRKTIRNEINFLFWKQNLFFTLFNSVNKLSRSSFHKSIGVRACNLFSSAIFSSRWRNKSSFFSLVRDHIVIPRR